MTLSQAATADGNTVLSASRDATTAPLAFDATAAQVQSALEGLEGIGTGNVTVSGGPGGAGGGSPYLLTFTGALAGVNVLQLSADAGDLTGGAASATRRHAPPAAQPHPDRTDGRFALHRCDRGASADGHRLYFIAGSGQLVPGGPPVTESGVYAWQDAGGTPGGTLSFIGELEGGDLITNLNSSQTGKPMTARVTPDGRSLLFQASLGTGPRPRRRPGRLPRQSHQ